MNIDLCLHTGQEIYLRQPSRYNVPEDDTTTFAQIAEFCRHKNETAIGYITAVSCFFSLGRLRLPGETEAAKTALFQNGLSVVPTCSVPCACSLMRKAPLLSFGFTQLCVDTMSDNVRGTIASKRRVGLCASFILKRLVVGHS